MKIDLTELYMLLVNIVYNQIITCGIIETGISNVLLLCTERVFLFCDFLARLKTNFVLRIDDELFI